MTELKFDEQDDVKNGKEEKTIDDIIKEIYEICSKNPNQEELDNLRLSIAKFLKRQISVITGVEGYNILILYDYGELVKSDADSIYKAVTEIPEKKDILLILHSRGGSAGSAYLIGKLCREYSKDKFVVSVPRFAKSAATLLSCAADEIHMGSLSELGPIDPQIDDLPALGLKNSIEHIAGLVKNYPESSDMFSKYLQNSLKLIDLGYYERVAESAKKYAEILLETHRDSLPRPPEEIAQNLVYEYKDHGFVIDKTAALGIFGGTIKSDTVEYKVGNILYTSLARIERMLDIMKYNFYFIGSLDNLPVITKRTKR